MSLSALKRTVKARCRGQSVGTDLHFPELTFALSGTHALSRLALFATHFTCKVSQDQFEVILVMQTQY
jgi:hypothetical protein